MELIRRFHGLVMDVGVSEGNDAAYYLAKGLKVIAVEADPKVCQFLRLRFKPEIESGALMLLNFAASTNFGDPVDFFVHEPHQGISSMSRRGGVDPAGYSVHVVYTINWRTLLVQAGLPRYVKIDIEEHEEQFLSGMVGSADLPEFISIEAYKFRPCEMLFEMGYERFKLVDQNPPGGFQVPAHQLEGIHVRSANFTHASGPFGLDLFSAGDWLDFEEFRQAWSASESQQNRTWFDCHAWKPN